MLDVISGGYRNLLDINSNQWVYYGSGGMGGESYTTSDGQVTFEVLSNYRWRCSVPLVVYGATGYPARYAANAIFSTASGGGGQYGGDFIFLVE